MQQFQGEKINLLINHLGLKHRQVAKDIDYHFVTLSKKAKDGTRFPEDKLRLLSKVLAVSVEYLKDQNRPFVPEEGIPEDARLKEVAPTHTQSEETIAALARSNEALANALADKDTMQRMMKDLAEEMAKIKREIAQMQDRR